MKGERKKLFSNLPALCDIWVRFWANFGNLLSAAIYRNSNITLSWTARASESVLCLWQRPQSWHLCSTEPCQLGRAAQLYGGQPSCQTGQLPLLAGCMDQALSLSPPIGVGQYACLAFLAVCRPWRCPPVPPSLYQDWGRWLMGSKYSAVHKSIMLLFLAIHF